MATFIDGFEIDVAVQEDHVYASRITDDPVEEGSPLSDSIRNMPAELTLTGIVSDFPLQALGNRRPVLDDSDTYTSLAYDRLKQIHAARLPVTIETGLEIYQNMGLLGLSVPRNADTGEALHFTARFKQLRLVTNQRISVLVAVPRLNRKKKKGAKQQVQAAIDNADSIFAKKAKYESTLSSWR